MHDGIHLGLWSVAELAAAYRSREVSPVEVNAAVAARIAELEPVVNALADRSPDLVGAAERAAAASERRFAAGMPLGPLDGIPVTVKENLARAGVPLRSGSAGATPRVPSADSPVVERFSAAGAVLIGTTTMPDWGMLSSGVSSLYGITRSPLDPTLTVGGSSAGAGAAAAGGYGPIHIGTDIGGSIRLPATWLGLVGHKPSYGRVPLEAPYLGRVAGPITRTVADAAAAMSVISGHDPRDWTALPAAQLDWSLAGASVDGLRVALLLDSGAGMPCDPALREVTEAAGRLFERGGAHVEVIAPWLTDATLTALDAFWRMRLWADLEILSSEARERVLPYIRQWAEAGAKSSGVQTLRNYQAMLALRGATVAATTAYDLVLSPVAPVSAFPAEWPMPWGDDPAEGMAHIGFTVPFSMSGQPSCAVPMGRREDGREIGVQLSGRRFDDVGVLRAATWLESAWPTSVT
jgi:aspartyl-tRNA(Asn)/glutamyl-tRNA(Gln) amidotransferase subunit A